MLQTITSNISGPVRHAKLEGRDYVVVPTVILTEGVHAGSNGPLFYPADELSASPASWDHKPILVYHAMDTSGQFVSASDAGVIERQKIGFMLNTAWKDGKLCSEAWIEIDRASQIDSRVMNAIVQNRLMEVSTGLFTINDDTPGEFNGKAYISIARNYQPDHLAILPDQIGACSIDAGCGLLQLNHAVTPATAARLKRFVNRLVANDCGCAKTSYEDTRRELEALLRDKEPLSVNPGMATPSGVWVLDLYDDSLVFDKNGRSYQQSYSKEGGKIKLAGEPMEVMRVTSYKPITNAFCPTGQGGGQDNSCSSSDGTAAKTAEHGAKLKELDERVTKQELKKLRKLTIPKAGVMLAKKGYKLGAAEQWKPGVKETFYSVTDKDGKVSRMSANDIKKLVSNKSTESNLVVNCSSECHCGGKCSSTEADNGLTVNQEGGPAMDRTQVINSLIASTIFNEDERGILEKMDDKKLQTLAACYADDDERVEDEVPGHPAGKKKKEVVTPKSGGMKSAMPYSANEAQEEEAPVLNAQQTLEAYIQAAPPVLREILTNGVNKHISEHASLVKEILTNKQNTFTEDELKGMNLNSLNKLAKLGKQQAAPAPANYFGQVGGGLIDNASSVTEEALPLPVMNFAEFRAAQRA